MDTREGWVAPEDRGKIFATIAATLLLGAAALIYHYGFPPYDKNANTLSAIILVGLALTVVFMAILGIIYSVMGVADRYQPLGLPEGSVRALLAFSLLLVFVCLSAFLFSEINGNEAKSVNDKDAKTAMGEGIVNDTQLSELRADFIVAAVPARDPSGKPLYEQVPKAQTLAQGGTPGTATRNPPGGNGPVSPGGGPGDGAAGGAADDLRHPLYKVTYYLKPNKDAADFAKQIFTTLATIFISVVSFYFGSSVTSSAVRTGATAAQGGDADKQTVARQTALTTALADSHNAQLAVTQASEKLDAARRGNNPEAEVPEAQKALEAAQKELADKQSKVADAQKSIKDARST